MRDFFRNEHVKTNMAMARGIRLLETFEGAYYWTADGTGGDVTIGQAAGAAWTGAYGISIKTRTTGAAADDVTRINRFFDRPQTNLLIARAMMTSPDWSKVKYASMALRYKSVSGDWASALRYTPATGYWAYKDSAGAYQTIALLSGLKTNGSWMCIEYAINVSLWQYLWAATKGKYFSLANIDFESEGGGTTSEMQMYFSVTAIGASPATLYVDDVLVTEYEEM
jgi:hypothetical protein